tara:strand:+ start:257 stop:601 length:345 start_codon:yes stop_codon:yes gene_type:complete
VDLAIFLAAVVLAIIPTDELAIIPGSSTSACSEKVANRILLFECWSEYIAEVHLRALRSTGSVDTFGIDGSRLPASTAAAAPTRYFGRGLDRSGLALFRHRALRIGVAAIQYYK